MSSSQPIAQRKSSRPFSGMAPRLRARVSTDLPPAPTEGPWPTEVLLFTQMPLEETQALIEGTHQEMGQEKGPGHQLLLLEHPPTYLVGAGGTDQLLLDEAGCRARGAEWIKGAQAEKAEYFGPGQLMLYMSCHLEHCPIEREDFVEALERMLLATLKDFGFYGSRRADHRGINLGTREIASISIEFDGPITQATIGLHVNTRLADLSVIRREDGLAPEITTLTENGLAVTRQDDVRETLLRHYEVIFASQLIIPQRTAGKARKPPWLKAKLPTHSGTRAIHDIIGQKRLHTVCESAHCPNQGECWAQGTATFMINGNVCSRSCSFCAIFTGRPETLDPDEPKRVAEAARQMKLDYVVVTAVNRDELADGGAGQFRETIVELREALPGVKVEVLIPDFMGNVEALERVFEVRPDVLNHNMETVARLYRTVRPQARYPRSLEVIERAKAAGLVTKSGFMLGLGEEAGEVEQLLRDLHAHGCDIVTIGQYLRPSEKHHPVIRYVPPSEFRHWQEFGMSLGLAAVESGPLVRSSYHAHDSFQQSRNNPVS